MISVVIPTHNRPASLSAALKSVYSQTRLPQEVLVVDDGSVPAVPKEIFADAPKGLDCRLLRHESARGANAARNTGSGLVSGDFIAFLDDDDQFVSEKVERLAAAIADNPDADLVYHPAHVRFVREGLSYISRSAKPSADECLFTRLLLRNFVGGTSMVTVRRIAVQEMCGFDEGMPALQDYDLWLRFARAGRKFHYISTPLTAYSYVSGDRSITKSLSRNQAAYALIEEKFALEFSALTFAQRRAHELRKTGEYAFKCVLNGHRRLAAHYYLKLCRQEPRFRNFALLGLSILGKYPVFYARSQAYRSSGLEVANP